MTSDVKPQVPEPENVQNGIQTVIDYLTTRGSTWWTLVAVAVLALVAVVALKNPLVRGVAIGAAALFCIALSAGMFK